MDRRLLSTLAHQDHPIAAPLSDMTVQQLLQRALPRGDERVLDLGCGEGEWLIQALSGRPGTRADGIDLSPSALAKARDASAATRLDDRLTLHEQDARHFTAPQPFDLVLDVGATHAFGGLLPALAAARAHLGPGGCVLVGEGFWECEPTAAALAALEGSPDEFDDLATTVARVTADGWTPVYGHVSTLEEWDDYEWSWTGSLSRWALDNPRDPGSEAARKAAQAHRDGWLHGYRGVLGFVTLLLRRS